MPEDIDDIEEQEEPMMEDEDEQVNVDLAKIAEMIQKVSDERDQLKDQLLRTMADFQNFRKRQEEQRKAFEALAAEKIVVSLLPVLDNFERTIASIDNGAPVEAIANGIKAVERQMRTALESSGVTRIPTIGSPFDPVLHEALGTEESEHPEDTVVKELEPGYKIGDRVLRPARVKVAK